MTSDTVDRIVEAWKTQEPDLDAGPLHVVGRLLLCAHHCERAIAAALEPLGLSFPDFDVINTLRRLGNEEGSNPSVLARSLLITTGAMTARLNRLEDAGLVERLHDLEDRRAVRVRLTPKGRKRATAALRVVLAVDHQFLEPLDKRQRESAAAMLKRLLRPWDTQS